MKRTMKRIAVMLALVLGLSPVNTAPAAAGWYESKTWSKCA